MNQELKISIYIDGNNLHRVAKGLGFDINYRKFRNWLRQKYNTRNVYIFMGFIEEMSKLYSHLRECEFILIFKQTISFNQKTKGNCDAELVLKVTSDFYTCAFDLCILVTNDGDFACVVEFLRNENALKIILAPSESKCSILLKNKNVKITFLDSHYHKFSNVNLTKNEKAPDADVSA